MEVSALKHTGAVGAHAKTPLLRLQSDERLVAMARRGNQHAFEALVGRYQSRLLAFCRHMLASKEDAEDVLQEVFAAAFNAMLADERPINVRPWLYRIARNRSLNHLRKATAIGVDSMDVHYSDHGLSTADRVHRREDFRLLLSDVQDLPETQRTALLLREIDVLSYDQIAEVMDTTVPSVKSLLVRARVSLAEAAEARLLSCEEVREELGEVAEGLARTTPPVRRHLRTCDRCQAFKKHLRSNNKALAAVLPRRAAASPQEARLRPPRHRKRGRRAVAPQPVAPLRRVPVRRPVACCRPVPRRSRRRPSPAWPRRRSSPPAPPRSTTRATARSNSDSGSGRSSPLRRSPRPRSGPHHAAAGHAGPGGRQATSLPPRPSRRRTTRPSRSASRTRPRSRSPPSRRLSRSRRPSPS